MEVVRVFNNELSSLYEVKPPISKAKMTQITKSAIKGIKFYKHIVQSVEKFIQKCRPEYKVPGLYVVDSIVRQSRHQFGADKDVFGPRFVKNITMTFQHLFKCAEDDRPKIIRVLNLWQKNAVFPIDVIQPLMDMGHPNTSGEWPANENAEAVKESPAKKGKEESRHKSADWKGWPQNNEEQVQDNKTYAEMSTKNLEKFNKAEMMSVAKDEEAMYKNQMKLEKGPEETVKFNKKLLDFDYGDEEDEEDAKNEDKMAPDSNALALSMAQNFLSNPELLRQLHQMAASTMQQNDVLKDMNMQTLPPQADDSQASYPQDMQSSPQLSLIPPQYQQLNMNLSKSETDTDDRVLPEPPLPSRDLDERSLASLLPTMCLPVFQQTGLTPQPPLPDKDDRIIPDPTMLPRDLDERSLASIIAPPDNRAVMPPIPYSENSTLMQFQYDKNGIPFQPPPAMPMMEPGLMEAAYSTAMVADPHLMQNSQGDEDERVMYSMPGEPPLPPQDFDERQIMMPVEDRSRKERSRSRSGSRSRGRGSRRRSRSRSPRRKRSRSRSHTRKGRSRSRDRGERIREKERERERERERRKKGLPPIKKGCVSVCSITLWLGHVPKSCSEMDIKNTFNQFGNILSIDMIPPRGCAYVVMDRRQDSYKALQKLKNLKLQGSSIKMAWAPGKGVKGKEYKEYWDVDLGVSYVPYEKIKEDADMLALLEEGGYIDEDSLPDQLKALRAQPDDEKNPYNAINKSAVEANAPFSDIQAAPNMVPPPIMPPTSVNIPMVLPHLMQPQFGLHLPGMLPPQAMVMQVPMGIPPPAPMLMVQQQSQGLLGNQPLSMVGGVPQIVPRPIPPATAGLSNIKTPTQGDSVLPAAPTGDATPTEEDGTGVSSPSVQKSASGTASVPTVPVPSTQPVVSVAQFNQILGMTANRPLLAVPPPVSTAGTPIPYPPPNMSFNFPPPGIRPPGQAHSMPPNPQFPWMQKQVGSPFTDADSSQTSTPSARPVPPPQSGMPVHMFGNRPPFHDSHSSVSNVNSSPMKEPHKGRESLEHKPGDLDGNRSVSPSHHDKMSQEMVISTDDESSMDIEYSRGDMPPGPCFQNAPDFQRTPMNMQRMRGPPGPMPPGPRFRGMPMGSPFPMRMGGPRGMGGPGMHNRMDMEFSPRGGRGPRMPMGPHGPRRNDGMLPPHEPRDWYPRDYEGPPFERERDRRYRDEWGREPWEMEGDMRRNSSRDREDRRDDHRDSWNRDRSNNARPFRDSNEKNDSPGRQRDKPPPNKGNIHKSLMNDLLKYQRGNSADYSKTSRNDLPKDKPIQKDDKDESNDSSKNNTPVVDQSSSVKEPVNELPPATKRERDREYRKRSRWGRTLSEEREFQQQKRNEIEMKFQSYEQSHAAQQPLQNSTDNPALSSEETSKEEPVTGGIPDMSALSSDVPTSNPVQSVVDVPSSIDVEMPAQSQETALQNSTEMPTFQNSSEIPSFENSSETPSFPNSSEIPPLQNNHETPPFQQNSHEISSFQNSCETPVQNFIPELSTEMESKVPSESNTVLSVPEVVNSCDTSDKVTFEANVIENASCTESIGDINANSDSDIIASTTNENSVLPDDVITNSSSLVSSES